MTKRHTDIPLSLLNIEDEGYHVMIQGEINGHQANFIIDTGASRSVFDRDNILRFVENPDFADKDGVSAGVGGTDINSSTFTINTIKLGECVISNYQGIAIDLQHIHSTYEMLGLPHIDGVLGSDIFVRHKANINFKFKRLRLFF